MKTNIILSLLLATGLIAGAMPSRAGAEPTETEQYSSGSVKFSCGEAADPSSRKDLPATIANVPGNSENTVLIIWKSEFFGAKYTPQERCSIVSSAIGTAFREGRTHIGSGVDKVSGLGIICALADRNQPCNKSNMLLTLKSYKTADETVSELGAIIEGKTGKPIYQSSGGKRVDLRNLLLKRRAR
jgi:Circadian oscillating protein COP23